MLQIAGGLPLRSVASYSQTYTELSDNVFRDTAVPISAVDPNRSIILPEGGNGFYAMSTNLAAYGYHTATWRFTSASEVTFNHCHTNGVPFRKDFQVVEFAPPIKVQNVIGGFTIANTSAVVDKEVAITPVASLSRAFIVAIMQGAIPWSQSAYWKLMGLRFKDPGTVYVRVVDDVALSAGYIHHNFFVVSW